MPREEGFVESMVHRVERHVEQWRQEESTRKKGAEARREELWQEAAERERLLAEAIGAAEKSGVSPGHTSREHGAVFVAHSEEGGRTLEGLAGDGARLTRVVPGLGSGEDSGARGSWLLFETTR